MNTSKIHDLAVIENLKEIKKEIVTSHMDYEKRLLIIYFKLETIIKELSK